MTPDEDHTATAIQWCSQHHEVVDMGRRNCRSFYRRQPGVAPILTECRITHRVELVPLDDGSQATKETR